MNEILAEFIGTALLLLIGNGVVANVVLNGTKGNGSGWIVITLGWGMAVFVAVFAVGPFSGAHINPAVTLGLAWAGSFPWAEVGPYIAAQVLGAAVGTTFTWLQYRQHFEQTTDKAAKLAVFCTGPAIKNTVNNFISEFIGTFVLVFGVLSLVSPEVGLGSIDALPVGLLVLAIGLGLGGTTGYAINPARDFAPRLMHAILPVHDKGRSDWGYAWIPVLGPIAGGIVAAMARGLVI